MKPLKPINLDIEDKFINPQLFDNSGVVAYGGVITSGRLLDAYRMGIFPWYSEPPVVWHSPLYRFVLPLSEFHISQSLLKILKKNKFNVTVDTCFEDVIKNCAVMDRGYEVGTWITDEVVRGYTELHRLGYAHSVEVWDENGLAGGLYGVAVGSIFCGESMFTLRSNASKVGFVKLVDNLKRLGFKLIDCQVYTDNMARYGAFNISRNEYLKIVDILKDQQITSNWKTEMIF